MALIVLEKNQRREGYSVAAQGKLASMSWVPRRHRCRLSLLVLGRKMATLVSFLCHLKAHLPLLYPAPNMLHD